MADSNFFGFFGFRLVEGQKVDVLNSPHKVVLTEKASIKYFGTLHGIAGRTIEMEDHPMTVSGVAADPPPNSHLQFEIIVPYVDFRDWAKENWKTDIEEQWVGGWPNVYVQLAEPAGWKRTEGQIIEVVARELGPRMARELDVVPVFP